MNISKIAFKYVAFVKGLTLFGLMAGVALTMSIRDANAYLITYDESVWNAAVTGSITNDNFVNHIVPGDTIVFDSGVTSSRSNSSYTNYVSGYNQWYLGTVSGGSTLTWTFPWEVTAFSFDVSSLNAGTTISGDFDGNGLEFIDTAAQNNTNIYNGFIGIIGTSSFDSFVFTGSSLTDSFMVDNLAFNQISVAEPSAVILLTLGLAGLGFMGRKKK